MSPPESIWSEDVLNFTTGEAWLHYSLTLQWSLLFDWTDAVVSNGVVSLNLVQSSCMILDEERNARWFGSAAVETITLLETRNTFRLILVLVLHSLHPGCRISFCHRAPSGRRTPVKKTAAGKMAQRSTEQKMMARRQTDKVWKM